MCLKCVWNVFEMYLKCVWNVFEMIHRQKEIDAAKFQMPPITAGERKLYETITHRQHDNSLLIRIWRSKERETEQLNIKEPERNKQILYSFKCDPVDPQTMYLKDLVKNARNKLKYEIEDKKAKKKAKENKKAKNKKKNSKRKKKQIASKTKKDRRKSKEIASKSMFYILFFTFHIHLMHISYTFQCAIKLNYEMSIKWV